MRTNFWKGYALVVTGALALVVGNSVLDADAAPEPHLSAALQKLQTALPQLEKATGSRAGHRARAIDLTKQAITEVQAAMAAPDESQVKTPKTTTKAAAPAATTKTKTVHHTTSAQ